MSGWFWVLFWWVAFGGGHVLLSSSPVRRQLLAKLGAKGFQGVYSLVALSTFVGLVWTYWRNKHDGPLLWSLASITGVRELSIALAGLAVIMLVLSFMQPSPTGMRGGGERSRGLTRITRHPLFAAFGLWGFSHLLVNSHLSDVIFFGGFLAFFLIGAAHQDARKQATAAPGMRGFFAETSLLPFAAIIAGRNRLVLSELPWVGALIGLAVAVALYEFHVQLFGG